MFLVHFEKFHKQNPDVFEWDAERNFVKSNFMMAITQKRNKS